MLPLPPTSFGDLYIVSHHFVIVNTFFAIFLFLFFIFIFLLILRLFVRLFVAFSIII